jgi:hypothetical protein
MSQAPIGPSFKRGAKVGVDVRFFPNHGAKADTPAGPSCAQKATSITDQLERDRKLKESTPRFARARPQPSSVVLNDRLADR